MRSVPDKVTASTANPSILDRIMVRARIRGHLEALKKRFPDLLGECEIQESAGTDYAYRLFVPKSAWTQVVAGLAEETDYDNFKDRRSPAIREKQERPTSIRSTRSGR